MAKLKEPQYKHLTGTAAVTTDNKAGILYYAHAVSQTAGDKFEINDSSTTLITLRAPSANGAVEFEPPADQRPTFFTDIDFVFSGTGPANITFVYAEIEI